jgi:hypothetical protein
VFEVKTKLFLSHEFTTFEGSLIKSVLLRVVVETLVEAIRTEALVLGLTFLLNLIVKFSTLGI